MADDLANLVPSAKEFMTKLALAEAAEASKRAPQTPREGGGKKGTDRPPDEAYGGVGRRGDQPWSQLIERAVTNGNTEVQIIRFPNPLCTDRGRAINQQETGWEETLTGGPKEIYGLWYRYFRDRATSCVSKSSTSRRSAGRCRHDTEMGMRR